MTDVDPPREPLTLLTENEACERYIEMWKQTVGVQQHFNDLEWRIRGLALTAATFALGASALAAKDGTNVLGLSTGTVVMIAGIILWCSFYFVDRYWYHPLLIGSVAQGEKIEDEILRLLPSRSGREGEIPAGALTKEITEASHVERPAWLKWVTRRNKDEKLHSGEKLKIFYLLGASALVLTAVMLQVAVSCSSQNPKPTTERVIEVIRPTDKPPESIPASTSPSPAAPAPKGTVTTSPGGPH